MRYYIGKWELKNGVYQPPQGMSAGLDLRCINDQSDLKQNGYGIFWGNYILGSNYDLLGSGDLRDIKSSGRLKAVFNSLVKYEPNGDTLNDMIFDLLTEGSHPDGLDGCRSLMPTGTQMLCLCLHKHGATKIDRSFNKEHQHWNKVRDVLRETYRQVEKNSKGLEHRQLLTHLGIKFGISDPENHFIPKDLPKERPLPPQTTYTETFPTNAGDLTSTQDLTWSSNPTDYTVSSNQLRLAVTETETSEILEAEDDLSDDDMSTTMEVVTLTNPDAGQSFKAAFAGVAVRTNTSANGYFYEKRHRKDGGQLYSVYKRVSSTRTNLVNSVTITGSLLGNMVLSVTGSTLSFDDEGTTTDTSIIGNVRGGIILQTDDTSDADDIQVDNIVITDDISDPPVTEPVRDIPLQTTAGCFTQSPFIGTQSISVPFPPKVMIFYSNRNLELSGVIGAGNPIFGVDFNANMSMGFATASGGPNGEYGVFPQCAVAQFEKYDGGFNTGARRAHTPSGCFLMVGEGTDQTANTFSTIGSAKLTQMGTTTKFNWDQVDGIGRTICYLAIGGEELTNFDIRQINTPSESGVVNYTGVGFQPGLLMSLSAGISDSGRVPPQTQSSIGFGFATGSGNQYANNTFTSSKSTVGTFSSQSNTNLIACNHIDRNAEIIDGLALWDTSAAFSGVHSDGYQLDWTGVAGSGSQSFVLAMEGNLYKVGTFRSAQDPNQIYPSTYDQEISGFGFRPIATCIASHGYEGFYNRGSEVSVNTISFTNEDIDFDVRDAPQSKLMFKTTGLYQPNIALSFARFQEDNSVIVDERVANRSLTPIKTGTLSSYDNDGLTVTWAANEGTETDFGYLTFGTKFAYKDMDFSMKAATNSGVATFENMSIKASVLPASFDLNIKGGVNAPNDMYIGGMDSASGVDMNMSIYARTPDNSGIDLYMSVFPFSSGNANNMTMYAQAPREAHGDMNMFIQVNDLVNDSGNFDIFMWSTTNPGLRDFQDFSIFNNRSGPNGEMNMFLRNIDTGEVTSNMNMYVHNDPTEDATKNIQMYIGASGDTETFQMFTQGLGTTDGALPHNDNMNLVIGGNQAAFDANFFLPGPSGFNNDITFHMTGQTNNSGVPMFINSTDTETRPARLFIRGF